MQRRVQVVLYGAELSWGTRDLGIHQTVHYSSYPDQAEIMRSGDPTEPTIFQQPRLGFNHEIW
jgi:hypothetical protein